MSHALAQSEAEDRIRIKPVKVAIELDDERTIKRYLVRVDSVGLYVMTQKKRVKAQLKNNCAECEYFTFDQINNISTTKPNKVAGHVVGGCLAGTSLLLTTFGGLGASGNVVIVMAYGLGYVIGSNASSKEEIRWDQYIRDRLSLISAGYQYEVEWYKLKYGKKAYLNMVKDQKFNRFIRYEMLVRGHGHMGGYIRDIDETHVYFVSAKNVDSIISPDDHLLIDKVPFSEILSVYIL